MTPQPMLEDRKFSDLAGSGGDGSLERMLTAHLDRLGSGDYCAPFAYIARGRRALRIRLKGAAGLTQLQNVVHQALS